MHQRSTRGNRNGPQRRVPEAHREGDEEGPRDGGKLRAFFKSRKEFVKKHGLNYNEEEAMDTEEEEKQGHETEGGEPPRRDKPRNKKDSHQRHLQ